MQTPLSSISERLGKIRESLAEANRIVDRWDFGGAEDRDDEVVEYYIERAFIETLVLLEATGLKETYDAVKKLNALASKNYAKTAHYEDLYSFWGEKLRTYINAVENALGEHRPGELTKNIEQILRSSVYAITDKNCFPNPPTGEKDVHKRIEAVLRCVFPDLRSKPPIAKPIKNFEPDTGLPEVRTLIEYKFIATQEDAKRVSDEVLADTRGYISEEWDTFIYVIYETKRVQPEVQWRELLRTCGVPGDTSIIVLSGEEPIRPGVSSSAPVSGPKRARNRVKTPGRKAVGAGSPP